MSFWKWSRTANTNASADSTINWAEGQPPSSVNDSARAMMAATAKYRDDIAGAVVTGGTSTAYTVSTYQVFDSLAHLDGAIIAFTPHTGNGATVTLNVDGTGAKPLRPSPNVELQSGSLIQGTPYIALYNNSDAVFYLHGSANNNTYSVPVAGGFLWFAGSPPNSSFAYLNGQAVSRSTYSTLFSLIATQYGVGDGSTTFNLPDLRGRVPAGLDNMGGTSSQARLSSAMTSTVIGNTGGAQQVTLGTPNLPPYTPAGSVGNGSAAINIGLSGYTNTNIAFSGLTPVGASLVAGGGGNLSNVSPALVGSLTFTGNAQGGTSTPFNSIPPTMVINFLMRVI